MRQTVKQQVPAHKLIADHFQYFFSIPRLLIFHFPSIER
jgi:hypothetical protein